MVGGDNRKKTNYFRLHFSLDQLSMKFIRQVLPVRDLQVFIKTSKLLVDCQQQCFFHVEVIAH